MTAEKEAPILEIRDLYKKFGKGPEILKGISFSLPPGSLTLLAGPNGCGKTVLMKHLNGLLKPTSGEVLFKGKTIFADIHQNRQNIGLIFQDPANQIVGQTVRKDAAFGPENLGLPEQEVQKRIGKALNDVGLEGKEDLVTHTLSGGEKKRLSVAGVLAMKPELIIFDEPFIGLDFPGVQAVLKQILALHSSGQTILVISHDLEKILAHTDRLLIMQNGCIVRDGSPDDFLNELESFGIRRPLCHRDSMTWLN